MSSKKPHNLTDIYSYHIYSQLHQTLKEEEIEPLQALLLLNRFSADLREVMRAGFAEFGISQSKYYILLYLHENSDRSITPSQIASFSGLSRATTSELIDGLDHEGLIERNICADDRRMIYVSITQKGREFLKKVLPVYHAVSAQLVSCLDENDAAQLASVIQKLSMQLDKMKAEAREKKAQAAENTAKQSVSQKK